MAALVAVLQSTDEDSVQHGSRDDAKLSGTGDCIGEAPVGHGDAHAALDDARWGEEESHPEASPTRFGPNVTDVSPHHWC
jgi:hypothetical protein